jgi:hypothetical protein
MPKRFEPAPLATDDFEDVGLAVRGAALAESPQWLPAVEQFGEGIFLKFSSNAVARWLGKPAVIERAQQLQAGVDAWIDAKRARGLPVGEKSLASRAVHSMWHRSAPCCDRSMAMTEFLRFGSRCKCLR